MSINSTSGPVLDVEVTMTNETLLLFQGACSLLKMAWVEEGGWDKKRVKGEDTKKNVYGGNGVLLIQ